jgi:diguanylate cyclase (GGDEF)-like protein/PAS domain S-box-containing protein
MDSAPQKLLGPLADAMRAEPYPVATRESGFFAASPLGMAAMDRTGRTLRVNRALCELLGHTEDELLRRSVLKVAHPDDQPRNVDAYRRFVAADRDAVQGETRLIRKDGEVIHAQYNVTAVRGTRDEIVEFVVQFVDDTRRRATLDALQQRLGEQAVITLLGERALAGLPLDDLIDEAVAAMAQILETEMAAYGQLAPDRATVTVRSSLGWPDGVDGSVLPISDAMRGTMGETVVLDTALRGDFAELLDHAGCVSGIAVLVGDPKDPLGILGAGARHKRRFGDADHNFVRAVAHVLAGAIERRRADDRARHEALHDALTGLPNRALLVDRLQQDLARMGGGGGQLFVLLLDVDSLRLVNDALGHAAGDELLREIGKRLSEVLEPNDTVARMAADEFGILCLDPRTDREAKCIAERVRGVFARPFVLEGEPHVISASMGVVVAGSGVVSASSDLLRDADEALLRAKDRGRGGYEFFVSHTHARAVSRLKLESELRRAIETGELRVEYQPYFRLSDGRPAGVEALVRWQHPDRGLVAPGDFIPVAEESGLIVPLGEWVLRRALDDLAAWRREHDWATGLRMTVNVSARQVHERELAATVAAALEESGIPAGLLGIEITEGLLLDQQRAPQGALSALKRLGVRLLLDDFGTGYSSLSYLSRFPVDVLKVDRSFVRDLGSAMESDPIVTAIVALARGLRLDVIAEGIETEKQADRLREIGCDYGQGFLMARPMPADQLVQRLNRA